MINLENNKKLAYLIIPVTIIITGIVLYLQGRSIICKCGKIYLWVGNIWSPDNSQHIFDPYSFTHLLHGFIFCWLLMALIAKINQSWQLAIVVMLESCWEIIENSNFVINRYRANTVSLGYQGDTIINSISDILELSRNKNEIKRKKTELLPNKEDLSDSIQMEVPKATSN
jgi:hypothetical protein